MYRRFRVFFSRMRLAVILILVLLLVTVVGALLPQKPGDLDAADEAIWLSRAQNRYGSLTDVMNRLGLFGVYRSAWFIVPFMLFMLNTLICTWVRLSGVWRAFSRPHRRLADRLFDRLPLRVALPAESLGPVRRHLSRRGFVVQVEQKDDADLAFLQSLLQGPGLAASEDPPAGRG